MKTIFALWFALCLSAGAALPGPAWLASATKAAGANMLASVWETFEFDVLSTANLEANDNDGGAGTWSITGPTNLRITNAAERATISTVNSTADTGTRGLAYDLNAGATAHLQYATNLGASAGSCGFWLYIPTFTGDFAEIDIWYIYGSSRQLNIGIKCASGLVTMRLSGDTDGTFSSTLTQSAWYWLTVKFQRNATSSFSIYDSTGAAITTQPGDCTARDTDALYFGLGQGLIGTPPTQNVSFFFDDFVINTSATFPLGP